ncbi:MAG: HD domain-containing phosphohydrolase [Bellilinea sp.]
MKIVIRKAPSILRFRLILIGILALLPSLGLVLYFGAQLREQAAENAKTDALQLMNLAASNQDALIEGARQTLITLSQVPVVRDPQSGNCDAFLAELLTHYPPYSNFVIAMPNGDVVCSGLPRTQTVNLADRAYFQRVLQTRNLAVSEYLIARGLGKAIITLAYPILDDAGQLKGILVVGLDLEWMNHLVERAELPLGSSLTVIDHNGTILTHYPDHEKYVGKTFTEAPIVKTILESKTKGTTQALGIDGIDRLYAYLPLENAGEPVGYMYIGIPSAVVFAEADRVTNTILIGLIIVTALGLTAIWIGSDVFLLRRMNALLDATQRLAAGDLSARASVRGGTSELSQLARAFDGMADSLQQRESEREQAEKELRALSTRQKAILAAIPDILMEVNKDKVYTWANPVGVEFFGEDVIGKEAAFYFEGEQDTYGVVKPLFNGSEDVIYVESWQRRKDGEKRLLAWWCQVLKDTDKNVTGALSSAHDITERQRAEERIATQLQRLAALRTIDTAITSILDLRLTLNVVAEQAIAQLGVDAAAMLLLNPHTQTLTYAVGRGFRTRAIEQSRVRLGEGLDGKAILERQLVHLHDPLRSPDFTRAALLAGESFVEYYAAPMSAKGNIVGLLEVFHGAPYEADEEWRDFLETLAGQAAIAVDNIHLFENLQRSNMDLALAYDATIEGWSHALDLRDEETEGHTQRVTELTERLARTMGISEAEIVHIRRGALLHDIGKMGVPDSILLKPDKLTDDEWKVMRQHPQFAFDMLAPIAFLRPALDIPGCHHEKWDGTGYPRGLKGEQIPLAARLFAVVDVWDALRSDRPYRKGWPQEKVIEHIKAGSGTHFDPKAVELFLKVMKEDTQGGLTPA